MKTLSKMKYLEGLKKMNEEEKELQARKEKRFRRQEIKVAVTRNQTSPPFKEEMDSSVTGGS